MLFRASTPQNNAMALACRNGTTGKYAQNATLRRVVKIGTPVACFCALRGLKDFEQLLKT